ncbi:hypothetical protein TrVE_jg2941 [Triparma verrucosa]|uniref:Uncharacterized protein n=1 Tax=Triparma verrucosa TaxID=1606542 RepID=A0A9W7KWQ6_9STRA|nr:hypothetical protein TrVE_jg2941 [Triparma verrucosa]
MNPNFNRSLFWKPKTGRSHNASCWRSSKIWNVNDANLRTKDDERYLVWLKCIHPIYLPFSEITEWICVDLIEKYENNIVERPAWMSGSSSFEFVKRVSELYSWRGEDVEIVDAALVKLFGVGGEDLERGVTGQLTFIKKGRGEVEPDKAQ